MHKKVFDAVSISNKHVERVEEVITSAFPFATVTFNVALYHRTRRAAACCPLLEKDLLMEKSAMSIGAQLEQHAPSDWKGEVGRTCSAFETTGTMGRGDLWRPLHQYFHSSSTQCPWVAEKGSNGVGAAGDLFPCWNPHAVVFVGGYERIDLRRVVLPALEEHVPTLQESDRKSDGDSKNNSRSGDARRPTDPRRRPPYERLHAMEHEMLHQRGCSIIGDDTMSLTIWLGDLPGAAEEQEVWWPTFLSFANPATSLSELHKERDTGKRSPHRSAFGYSLPLITSALPPPMVLAARLLNQCGGGAGPQSLLPFWLSATAHSVSSGSARCVGAQAQRSTILSQNARRYLRDVGETLQRGGERASDSRRPRLVESQLVAYALALQVLADFSERPDAFLHNFFLPQETFVDCDDVAHVLKKAKVLANHLRNDFVLQDLNKLLQPVN